MKLKTIGAFIYAPGQMFLIALLSTLQVPAIAQGENPTSLAAILKGAEPGMALNEFWDAHPEARPGREDRYLGSDAIAEKHITLYEDTETDDWLKLPLMASFGFVEHQLEEWVLTWQDTAGDGEKIQSFLEGCVQHFGRNFQREAVRLHTAATTSTELDVLLPALVWLRDSHCLLAYHQRRIEKVDDGTIQSDFYILALLPSDDPFLENILVGDRLSIQEIEALYSPFPWLGEGVPVNRETVE